MLDEPARYGIDLHLFKHKCPVGSQFVVFEQSDVFGESFGAKMLWSPWYL